MKVHYGRVVRIAVYLMLALSAGTSVFASERLWEAAREGTLPMWAPLLAPLTFTAFVTIYTVDRWLLVRRRHYPTSRALFQVAIALVFLTLLLPDQAVEFHGLRVPERSLKRPALSLLGHAEAKVRSGACDLMAGQIPVDVYTQVQNLADHDLDATVRDACTHALLRLHPSDP